MKDVHKLTMAQFKFLVKVQHDFPFKTYTGSLSRIFLNGSYYEVDQTILNNSTQLWKERNVTKVKIQNYLKK
jgi:hypothetical protein